MFLTSQLRNAWHTAALNLARSNAYHLRAGEILPPAPSSVPPPPEEFVEAIRAMSPYAGTRNMLTTLAGLSTAMDVPPATWFPLEYMAGFGLSPSSPRVRLTMRLGDTIGVPVVFTDPFPVSLAGQVSRSELQDATEDLDLPPPSSGRGDTAAYSYAHPPIGGNHVWFTSWNHRLCCPKFFETASEVTAEQIQNEIAPRELTRSGRKMFLDTVLSLLRYTGCMRLATAEEVDALFQNMPVGAYLRMNNLSDFFITQGISSSIVHTAAAEGQRLPEGTAPVAPPVPTATDVPSSTRRGLSPEVEAAVLSAASPRARARRRTDRLSGLRVDGMPDARAVTNAEMPAPTVVSAEPGLSQGADRLSENNTVRFTTPTIHNGIGMYFSDAVVTPPPSPTPSAPAPSTSRWRTLTGIASDIINDDNE